MRVVSNYVLVRGKPLVLPLVVGCPGGWLPKLEMRAKPKPKEVQKCPWFYTPKWYINAQWVDTPNTLWNTISENLHQIKDSQIKSRIIKASLCFVLLSQKKVIIRVLDTQNWYKRNCQDPIWYRRTQLWGGLSGTATDVGYKSDTKVVENDTSKSPS